MKYIDVSYHQGVIDWETVKGHIDGAILRAGYGRGTVDKQFHRNASECNRLGIPCGAYWFSYAYTEDMARLEAQQFLMAVRQHEMALPLAFDYEYDSVKRGKESGASITPALVKAMANAFCQTVEAAGYYCMLYANPDFINRYFGALANRYDLWLAQWPKRVDVTKPPRACGIWQWGCSYPTGIKGKVDTNEAYKDYATFLREKGFNHLSTKPPVASAPVEEKAPWYAEAMDWAKENGVCDGTRPEDVATRAEVAQMFYNMDKRYSGLLTDD